LKAKTMPAEIRVPTLGESVSEATVAKWLKKVGDSVAVDDALVELETDKVTLEVNAKSAGVLKEIKVQTGSNVAVGAVLVVTSGPSILLSVSDGASGLLDASCAAVANGLAADPSNTCVISNLGPFAKLAWTIQTWSGRLLAVFGAALWAYKWFQALRKVDLEHGASTDGSRFSAIRNAFTNSSAVAIGTVIGYIAIMRGPDLIYGLIRGGSALISVVPK
jgi:hypothetical protein